MLADMFKRKEYKLNVTYYFGPNSKELVDFFDDVARLDYFLRKHIIQDWSENVSYERDLFIEAAWQQAISQGRFIYLLNVGRLILDNYTLYYLNPVMHILPPSKLDLTNSIWIRALEKMGKVFVVKDLLREDIFVQEFFPFEKNMSLFY